MMKEDDVHPFPRSNNSFTRLSAYAVHSRGIFGLCSADLSPLPSFLHYCVVGAIFGQGQATDATKRKSKSSGRARMAMRLANRSFIRLPLPSAWKGQRAHTQVALRSNITGARSQLSQFININRSRASTFRPDSGEIPNFLFQHLLPTHAPT